MKLKFTLCVARRGELAKPERIECTLEEALARFEKIRSERFELMLWGALYNGHKATVKTLENPVAHF